MHDVRCQSKQVHQERDYLYVGGMGSPLRYGLTGRKNIFVQRVKLVT